MTNDSTTLNWAIPCDQDLAFAITIGGNTYRVKEEQLISSDSTSTMCTSLVTGWANPDIRAYLFGRPFATSAYIAYQGLLDSSADQIGIARRAGGGTTIIVQHPGVSVSTVVASIVGSILGVAIVAALFFLFLRRRRRARSDAPDSKQNVKKKYIIEPFTGYGRPNSSTPLIHATGGQDPWIVEQGEIGGEPGTQHDPRSESWNTQNGYSPQRKSPLHTRSSPNLVLERQSQITNSMYSPAEPSPLQPGVSTPGRPSPPPAPPERPEYETPELAPPPYER